MTMVKSSMTIKCTSCASRFDGHGNPPVGYKPHCLMQHVQGYIGSHWMLPLGNYSLRITPVAARATANKTTAKTCTHFAGHFNGHGGAPVQYRTHCSMEEIQGLTRSQRTPPLGEYCSR
jgi:hypothetical protein